LLNTAAGSLVGGFAGSFGTAKGFGLAGGDVNNLNPFNKK